VREHQVEVGALQLEELWTWGIAGERESGLRFSSVSKTRTFKVAPSPSDMKEAESIPGA
jgi:hypothetical protein